MVTTLIEEPAVFKPRIKRNKRIALQYDLRHLTRGERRAIETEVKKVSGIASVRWHNRFLICNLRTRPTHGGLQDKISRISQMVSDKIRGALQAFRQWRDQLNASPHNPPAYHRRPAVLLTT